MAILIIGREFAVSGLRSIAAAEGYTIKASDLGKTKMFFQVVAISCMLISVRHPGAAPAEHAPDVGGDRLRAALGGQLLRANSGARWTSASRLRRRRELLTLERKRQKALRRQMGLSRGKEGLGAATIWKPPEVN